MIVLLEGTDGAGKSSFAELLRRTGIRRGYKVTYLHRGVPERSPLDEYELDLEEMYPYLPEDRADTLFTLDRWHMGQPIYGGLYRDANDLGDGGVWHVDAFLQARGALQLVLAPGVDVLRERTQARGEDYLKDEHIEHVSEAYLALANKYHRSVSVLTDENLNEPWADLVLDMAVKRNREAQGLYQHIGYVGPIEPDILIVGNTYVSEEARMHAAFAPSPGSSSAWLCDTIVHTPLNDRKVGLISIHDRCGTPNFSKLLEDLEPAQLSMCGARPKVVALGDRAHLYLAYIGMRHGTVETHPEIMNVQYPHARSEYADAILRAAASQETVSTPWN